MFLQFTFSAKDTSEQTKDEDSIGVDVLSSSALLTPDASPGKDNPSDKTETSPPTTPKPKEDQVPTCSTLPSTIDGQTDELPDEKGDSVANANKDNIKICEKGSSDVRTEIEITNETEKCATDSNRDSPSGIPTEPKQVV